MNNDAEHNVRKMSLYFNQCNKTIRRPFLRLLLTNLVDSQVALSLKLLEMK